MYLRCKLLVAFPVSALVLAVGPIAHAKGWQYTVLHTFGASDDGAYPVAALTLDRANNIYGTAKLGGVANCEAGCGTVFKIAADGTYSTLYSFTGPPDGGYPLAGVLLNQTTGVLTGTTGGEGAFTNCSQYGCGTVYQVAADGTEKVLHNFDGANDGYDPIGMVQDTKGNFYGVAAYGGTKVDGGTACGTLFRYSAKGSFSVLYAFSCAADGWYPQAGLIRDKAGNLYGTTLEGATACGSVYKFALQGTRATESVLYAFSCGDDGESPEGLLARDDAANLYGVTYAGGTYQEGVVYKLAPDGTETVLHSFGKGHDGYGPAAGLVAGSNGVFYGTTEWGGAKNDGTVYSITAAGSEKVLYSLDGVHGARPAAQITVGPHDVLYGTAYAGGANDAGVVFRLKGT